MILHEILYMLYLMENNFHEELKKYKSRKIVNFTMQTDFTTPHDRKQMYKKKQKELKLRAQKKIIQQQRLKKRKIKKQKLEEEIIKKIQMINSLDEDVKNNKAILKQKKCSYGGGPKLFGRLPWPYQTETDALLRLANNFQCLCGRGNHFPTLLYRNFDDKPKYYMTYMGTDLMVLDHNMHVSDIIQQINCIVYNLRKSNIVHLDILRKNICIDDDGKLSLIDFEHILIDKKNLIDGKRPHDIYKYLKTQFKLYNFDATNPDLYYEKIRDVIFQCIKSGGKIKISY